MGFMCVKPQEETSRLPLEVLMGLVIGVAALLAKNPDPGHGLYVYKTKTETEKFLFAVRTGFFSVHTNRCIYPQLCFRSG